MVKPGNRKFFAFLITVVLFTVVVLVGLFKHNGTVDMPTFAFQLASAYAIMSGLFFGSNALVHIAAPRLRSGTKDDGDRKDEKDSKDEKDTDI
jgi:hypothetical protein